MTRNQKAFLDMLGWSEGTDRCGKQFTRCHGYDVMVGGGTFTDFKDHPRKLVNLPRYGIKSSAAGRYQFLRATWDDLAAKLRLTDFSPASQDKACLQLLRECGALPYIDKGDFTSAVFAARRIWASLPSAGYGQREQSLSDLRNIYTSAGGTLI